MRVRVYLDGRKEWKSKGRLHRVNGPAVEHKNGDREWYRKGEKHRLNGPAIEWSSGSKEWWVNGKTHRLDGPAVDHIVNEHQEWWVRGRRLGDKQIRSVKYFVKRIKHIIRFVRAMKMTIGRFMRLIKLVRTEEFVRWFYSPEQSGGKIAKAKLSSLIMR